MGNHQFGFINRPPEFIGKSWSYVTEKRRKSSAMRRPNSSATFSDVYMPTTSTDAEAAFDPEVWRSRRGTSEPHEPSPKPSKTKRRGSMKHTRSMLRCSPTVPDALTLSLDVATAGIGMGMATVADAEAVASALSAIQKLTPAAPNLFREPVFDDFFEEAERRNLTMEVLQAALIAPSGSADDDESRGDEHRPSIERRRSPAKSLAAMSGARSKEKLNVIYATSSEEGTVFNCADRITTNGCSTSELEGLASSHSKGRLLVIVASGASGGADGESKETDHWDKSQPTIIVQPGSRPLFASSCSATSNMTAAAPSSGGGGLPSRSAELRRGSVHPCSSTSSPVPSSGPLGVRFADQTPPIWFSESEDAAYRRSDKIVDLRYNRRTSLRRKTIGGVVNLELAGDVAAMSAPDISSETATVTSTTVTLARAVQRSEEHRPPTSVTAPLQPPLRKKSLSKSDLLCPPPIITLLKQPQINLVRQLWQQLYNTKGPTVLGNHIFQRVFFKNPQIKDVFRNVDVGNQHVNVDGMCKAHAKAVAGVLDDVVKNLENLREVENKLMDVGRKHAIFNDLGFHINFWSVFAEAFIDCTLEWGEKNRRVEESRKAWAIIIAYITDKMKFGFQEARRNLPRPGRRVRQTDGIETPGTGTAAP